MMLKLLGSTFEVGVIDGVVADSNERRVRELKDLVATEAIVGRRDDLAMGHDKDGGLEAEFLEDGKGIGVEVSIAVVEGENDGFVRKGRRIVDASDQIVESNSGVAGELES